MANEWIFGIVANTHSTARWQNDRSTTLAAVEVGRLIRVSIALRADVGERLTALGAVQREAGMGVRNHHKPGAEAAWEEEIVRRIARFKSGESKPIPAGEVFARLRQIAPDR